MDQSDIYRDAWKTMSYDEQKRVKRIQELNDRLRKILPRRQDMIVVMGDLQGEDAEVQLKVYQAARDFNAFTEDNDPHGEHDCATFKVEGIEGDFMFKIDYYDPDLMYHSEDAADPQITRRVMTLMYAKDR